MKLSLFTIQGALRKDTNYNQTMQTHRYMYFHVVAAMLLCVVVLKDVCSMQAMFSAWIALYYNIS